MINKYVILHTISSDLKYYRLNRFISEKDKFDYSYRKYLEISIHAIRAIDILFSELAEDVNVFIMFKDYLYQYERAYYKLLGFSSKDYCFLTKKGYKGDPDVLKSRHKHVLRTYYEYLIVSINILPEQLQNIFFIKEEPYIQKQIALWYKDCEDEDEHKWAESFNTLLSFDDNQLDLYESKVQAIKTIDMLNDFGNIATEFLVRVLGHTFEGYNGNQKIIVTSSLTPNQDFRKQIEEGWYIDKLTPLVYDKNDWPFYNEKQVENIKKVREDETLYDNPYPYIPTDEDRIKTRARLNRLKN